MKINNQPIKTIQQRKINTDNQIGKNRFMRIFSEIKSQIYYTKYYNMNII